MKSRLLSSPLLTVVLTIFFGYLVVNAVLSGLGESANSAQDELMAEVSGLMEEKRSLESELAWVKTDEFVEQEARNKLYLVKPGEKMVVYPEESPVLAAQAGGEEGSVRGGPAGGGQEVSGSKVLPGHVGDWLRVFGMR